jgi:two-component system, cell cycle sensor histidine kinase and response regulator CckA
MRPPIAAVRERTMSEQPDPGIPPTARPLPSAAGLGRIPTRWHEVPTPSAPSEKLEAISRLAGGVTHHFNNLLTVIQGSAAHLLETSGDAVVREEAAEILAACRSGALITSELLSVTGRQMRRPQLLDLRSHLAECDLEELVSGNVVFCLDLPATPCLVLADPSHMRIVATNLVRNAQEAVGDAGAVVVRLEVLPGTTANGARRPGWVQLEVTDNGAGMEPATADLALDPFFSTRNRGSCGGMGLAVVHGIVRQSGGSVAIETAPGQGTRVRVWIPSADGAATGPAAVR